MKLEQKIYRVLTQKGYKVATAESCTGGLVAATIINVSGASQIIDMSFVTYSNQAKEELVYVKNETLKEFGAVSEQVAMQMAQGAKQHANANIGLATSGIAGPSGGTKTKPVGMVCFGICVNDKTYTYTHIFKNISRTYIRKQAVKFVLKKLLEILKNE